MDAKISDFYEATKNVNLDDTEVDEKSMEKISKIMNSEDDSYEAEELADVFIKIMDIYTCSNLLIKSSQKEEFKGAMDKKNLKITDLECYKNYVENILGYIEQVTEKNDFNRDEFIQMIITGSKQKWQDMDDEDKENNVFFMEKELKQELKI